MKSPNYGSALVSSLTLPAPIETPFGEVRGLPTTFNGKAVFLPLHVPQSVASVVLARRTNRNTYLLSAQSTAFRYAKALSHAIMWRNKALACQMREDFHGQAQCKRFMRECALRAVGYLSLLPSQDY